METKVEFYDIDIFKVTLSYELKEVEPVKDYPINYWSYDIKSITTYSELLDSDIEMINILSVEQLGKIDDEIEKILNNRVCYTN